MEIFKRIERIQGQRKLAQALLDIVEAEQHYDQTLWLSGEYFQDDTEKTGAELRAILGRDVCGTKGCVAGNTVILTLPMKGTYNFRFDEVTLPDGTELRPSEYAQKKLGLSYPEASWLFNSNRTIEEVKQALKLIASGRKIKRLVPTWYFS